MMAAGDLVSLAVAKQYLGLFVVTEDDPLLERLVSAASEWFKRELGDAVLLDSYSDPFVGEGTQGRTLLHAPVTEVTKVTVDGKEILEADYVSTNGRVQLVSDVFTFGKPCSIDYIAGFDVVPADIVQAVCELVAYRYRRRDSTGHLSKSIGGELVTFQPDSGAMAAIQTVLSHYRGTHIA